jgi:ABC-type branched-subunit amino acid transport system substrate-binding protein
MYYSEALAAYGARISLPQISAFSSVTSLSNKEFYPYFSRTSQDNHEQSEALIDLLEVLGITPNIAIVSDSTSYSMDLTEHFITG